MITLSDNDLIASSANTRAEDKTQRPSPGTVQKQQLIMDDARANIKRHARTMMASSSNPTRKRKLESTGPAPECTIQPSPQEGATQPTATAFPTQPEAPGAPTQPTAHTCNLQSSHQTHVDPPPAPLVAIPQAVQAITIPAVQLPIPAVQPALHAPCPLLRPTTAYRRCFWSPTWTEMLQRPQDVRKCA